MILLKMSSKQKILSLYRSLIRESKRLESYNFRSYALRRVKDAFKENKTLVDLNHINDNFVKGVENLTIIKQQVIVGAMYKSNKLVIEN